ncbi:MAG: ribosomal protection-like ABC-F family protein [Planctomycetaceae bacterium]
MALVSLREVSFGYGGRHLLEKVDLQIERGERVGLVGRNGSGKSTLMKLISGELSADDGQVLRGPGVRIGRLIQEVPLGSESSVQEVVAMGLTSPTIVGESSRRTVEPLEDWELEHQVERVLEKMSLDPHARFAALSSGMKRRVLLAQALVSEPDLLLLDEPTNHLDIEAVAWLEEFLIRYGGTLVFVTHDRVFLRKLSNRIIEVDRGRLLDWPCDYTTFLLRKESALEVEAQHQALFDKKLAQEEIWVRTGVKARRTRSEARIRELNKMREERRQRKDRVGNVRLLVQDAERSGRLVIEAKKISFQYARSHAPLANEEQGNEERGNELEGRDILREFSTLILRGDKIGVIGPNGSGKSTLLRLLLGQLQPTTGTVRLGTKLEVAYFDQLREQLDENKTAQENVGDGKQTLVINGQERHVLGYLQEFLFSPERARTLVRYLSGGERNRLMLAKLLTKPSNMLVLDEPTNDLDAETLELLEDLLIEYPGTVLLVSHDREFLNNVVSSTLVFEGNGVVKEYDGGYDDWQRQRTVAQTPAAFPETVMRPSKSGPAPRKLSFKEQRELESLPGRIDQLETQQAALHAVMSAPSFYQQPKSDIAATSAKLETLERELAEVFARWESLEAARS